MKDSYNSEPDVEFIQKLIEGKLPPPNDYARFILEQLQVNAAQGQQVQSQLAAARMQVKKLEEHLLKLVGVQEQYVADLQKWAVRPKATAPSMVEEGQSASHEAPPTA